MNKNIVYDREFMWYNEKEKINIKKQLLAPAIGFTRAYRCFTSKVLTDFKILKLIKFALLKK